MAYQSYAFFLFEKKECISMGTIIKAIAKLKGESVCDTRVPAQPILAYLIKQCEDGNEELATFIMQDIKMLEKCYKHVFDQVKAHVEEEIEKAKEEHKGQYTAWVDDSEVYQFAVDYYEWSAVAEAEAEAEAYRKRIEAEEKATKEKEEREEKAKKAKAKADAKGKKAKENAEKENGSSLESFMDKDISYFEPIEEDEQTNEPSESDSAQTVISFNASKTKKKQYNGDQMTLFQFEEV